jgi:hypothetical protein
MTSHAAWFLLDDFAALFFSIRIGVHGARGAFGVKLWDADHYFRLAYSPKAVGQATTDRPVLTP